MRTGNCFPHYYSLSVWHVFGVQQSSNDTEVNSNSDICRKCHPSTSNPMTPYFSSGLITLSSIIEIAFLLQDCCSASHLSFKYPVHIPTGQLYLKHCDYLNLPESLHGKAENTLHGSLPTLKLKSKLFSTLFLMT